MSQQPPISSGEPSIEELAQKAGSLATLYTLYRVISASPNPLAAEASGQFSVRDLQMMQWIDAHPEAQRLLQQYNDLLQQERSEFAESDANTPRLGPDGSIYTNSGQLRQAFIDGLNAVTTSLLGAIGGVLGQYWYPDGPVQAARLASIDATLGAIGGTAAGALGQLSTRTTYTPDPGSGDLYAPKLSPENDVSYTAPGQVQHISPPSVPPWTYGELTISESHLGDTRSVAEHPPA